MIMTNAANLGPVCDV